MKIINKVTDESYIQWIEQFVKTVLERAELKCREVVITDIEHSKRIYLEIDGKEYDIRTWNFEPVNYDTNGEICAENVRYTLFKMVSNGDGSGHGEIVDEGALRIEWENGTQKEQARQILRDGILHMSVERLIQMSNFGLTGFVDVTNINGTNTTVMIQNSFNCIDYDEQGHVITFAAKEINENCYGAVSFNVDSINTISGVEDSDTVLKINISLVDDTEITISILY